MKYAHVYTLFLVFVSHTSCGQNQTKVPQDNIKSSRGPTANYSESKLKENSAGNLAVSLADTSRVPIGQVRNIKQDRNGNILIAARWGGVLRYDGKSFTNLTSKIGSHILFFDVLEDRKGNIWFTSTDGVYYYDEKSLPTGQAGFQHFTTREGLANDTVMSIYEDKAGIIWFGTNGGISRYDGKSFRNFTIKGGHWNNVITTIMEDKTGKLWIGSRGDVSIYDGKTFTTFTNKDGTLIIDIWSIIEDKKGNIWLGGYDGLRRYDGKTFTYFTHNSRTYVLNIIEDKQGNIWTTGKVPNGGRALSRYDQKSLYNKNPTVTEIMSGGTNFRGLLEANDGSIWFGYASGLYRYDGKTITDLKSKEGQQ